MTSIYFTARKGKTYYSVIVIPNKHHGVEGLFALEAEAIVHGIISIRKQLHFR